MDWRKVKLVSQILRGLAPIVWAIVDDIFDAKRPDSQGGEQITKEERRQIIFDHLLTIPEQIEKILREM